MVLKSPSTSSEAERYCSHTSAWAPSSRTISVRQLSALLGRAWVTVANTGASSVALRGTYTNSPPTHAASLRAANGSSPETIEPR